MIYIKIISLAICLWYTPSFIVKAIRGHEIGWEFLLGMAIGWMAFIVSMGWLA